MAYTKILVIHNRLDKCLDYAQDKEKTALSLAEAIDYALNRDKTEQACFETGLNCDVEAAWRDMLATKRRWGKVRRKRQGYHIIQSFAPDEVTPEEAHAVGVEFAQRLFGERYEAIVTTHLNKAHLHNHVVVNSVSMLDGAMYRDTFQDYYGGDGVGIRGTSDATCQAHGLSVIEPDPENPDRRRSRPEWEGKTTIRDTVRRDIDAALGRAYTLQSLLQELRRMGYQVQAGNRKHISIRPPGGAGNIRLDSLGDGYTEADLKARLEAIRTGQPAPPGPPPPASPWRSPGRKYRVRGGFPRRTPRKLHGFQALCFKYLYLLRSFQKGRPQTRAAFSTRQELIKLDRYQRQFRYLHQNHIETAEQLSMQYDALQAEIDALTDRRGDLYRLRRSGHEEVSEEIGHITAQLRALRRDLKLCARIEGDIPRIREAVEASETQRSIDHEKTDKSRPGRHPAPGRGVPLPGGR
ncbi:MAG: relaxase/mobilization nuclease domain-containing protein [Lawsonibacter sp.]|jgi:hypothetical protein